MEKNNLINLLNRLRNSKGYSKLVEDLPKKVIKEMFIHVIVGKLDRIQSEIIKYINNENVFKVNIKSKLPFDGYNGEKIILIENFKGNIKFNELKEILDGGYIYAQWNKIYITSTKEIENWYKSCDIESLKRRLHEYHRV